MSATTTIDLMRHGQPEGGQCYRGWIDHPLSQSGWQQMLLQLPQQLKWQYLITSPLLRCSSFAEQLCRDSGLPLAYIPDLKEIGFGDWEGKTAEQLEHHDKAAFYAFYDDPINNTPPNAEPFNAFQSRVLTAWHSILRQYQSRHALVVTHGGVIRIILAYILNQPQQSIFDIDVPLASLHRIEIRNGQASLLQTTENND